MVHTWKRQKKISWDGELLRNISDILRPLHTNTHMYTCAIPLCSHTRTQYAYTKRGWGFHYSNHKAFNSMQRTFWVQCLGAALASSSQSWPSYQFTEGAIALVTVNGRRVEKRRLMSVKRCREDLMTYSIRNESLFRCAKLMTVKLLSLYNYVCAVYMQEPLRPEDSTGSQRTGVSGSCELWCRCYELNLSSKDS